jgi:hypothetical protein
MSSCINYTAIPGTPTLSSGLTAQKAQQAIRCDQARILAMLQNGAGTCCKLPQTNKVALFASILEDDRATRCQPSPVVQAFNFPRAGTTENIRIQKTQTNTIRCSVDTRNPNTAISNVTRTVTPEICPGMTAEQLNSTMPKPPIGVCQPSRFY